MNLIKVKDGGYFSTLSKKKNLSFPGEMFKIWTLFPVETWVGLIKITSDNKSLSPEYEEEIMILNSFWQSIEEFDYVAALA